MTQTRFVNLPDYRRWSEDEMERRSAEFFLNMKRRRSVRDFSPQSVPDTVIENCIRAAGTAPSGANMQPWRFVAVKDVKIKRRIRAAAEAEEKTFYEQRAPQEWLEALAELGTDWRKPFLETAPYLIAIFYQRFGVTPTGKKIKRYYAIESVGIATGILITALHVAGLATLTHTPSPMGFLNEILNRPKSEKPFLLLVTGYPAENARVPVLTKKRLSEIARFV